MRDNRCGYDGCSAAGRDYGPVRIPEDAEFCSEDCEIGQMYLAEEEALKAEKALIARKAKLEALRKLRNDYHHEDDPRTKAMLGACYALRTGFLPKLNTMLLNDLKGKK